MMGQKLKHPIIIAHRGAGVPENSCLVFRQAIQSGYEGVELDVHQTKEGVLVVHHDKRVKNRFLGPLIAELTLKQVKSYDIGVGERIPTLKEALNILKGKTIIDVEVKPANIGTEVAQQVTEVLGTTTRWSISSFQQQVLADINAMDSNIPTGYLYVRGGDNPLKTAIDLGCHWVHPHHRFLKEAHVKKCQETGLKIGPWTVNQPNQIIRMLNLEVDAIITDNPVQAMKLRQQHQRK